MSHKKRYIIAGGGFAGLSAAIELASHGHTVELYEQSKSLGGRAATHSQQRYSMNIGPHGFYRAGLMKATVRRLGNPLRWQTAAGQRPHLSDRERSEASLPGEHHGPTPLRGIFASRQN